MSMYDALSPESMNVINLVNTHLQWKHVNDNHRNNEVYHPSAWGKCLRKMQYELYAYKGLIEPVKGKKSNEILRVFDTGHAMHHRWAKYFEDIGVLRGYWHCANAACALWNEDGNFDPDRFKPMSPKLHDDSRMQQRRYGYDNILGCFKPKQCTCGSTHFYYHEISVVNEETNFAGHADQILDFSQFDPERYKTGNAVPILFKPEELPKKPIVVDMKTIHDGDFQYKLQKGPHPEYEIQLNIYINILGLELGLLIYENKNDSKVKLFEIKKNSKQWDKIKNQAVLMKGMIEEKRLPPPRPASKSEYECRNCPFRSKCHGDDTPGKQTIWDHPEIDKLRKDFYGE